MDTLAKKILVDFEVIDAQAKAELKALTKDISNLRKAISDAEKDWINMKFAIESLGTTTREQQATIDQVNQRMDEQRRTLDASRAAVQDYRVEQERLKVVHQQARVEIDRHKKALAEGRVEQLNAKKAILETTQQLEQSRLRTSQYAEEIAKLTLKTKQEAEARREANKNYVPAIGSYDEANKRLKELGKSIKAAEGGFLSQNETIKAQIKEYNALNDKIKAFDARMGNHQRNVGNYAKGYSNLNMSVAQVARELPALGNSFQTFTMAIGNNIPAVQDALKQTRAQIAATRTEIIANADATAVQAHAAAIAANATEAEAKAQADLARSAALANAQLEQHTIGNALLKSVLNWQVALTIGITLLILYSKEIGNFVKSLFKGKDAIDQAKLSIADLNKALASTDYTNAIENVRQLKTDIELARQKLVDKTQVVKEYNDKLGDAMGSVKTLAQVEAKIAEKADAYVKMTLYKAAAHMALQESAKLAYEAQQEQLKDLADYESFMDRGNMFGITSAEDAKRAQDQMASNQRKRQNDKLQIIYEGEEKQLNIQKYFADKAAQIAKENGLNYFADGKLDKPKKPKKGNDRKEDAYAASEAMLKSSQMKELEMILDTNAKELLAADEHYNQEMFKLDRYLRKKLITQEQYSKVEAQLSSERNTRISQITTKFQREDAQRVTDLQNEILALQNESIRNQTQKELANLEQQTKLKMQALDRQDAMLQDEINRSELAVEKLHGKEQDEERRHLAVLNDQLQQSYTKRGLIIANGEKSAQDIKRAARDKVISEVDEARVLDSDRPRNEREHFKAVMTKLDNDWKREVENAERIGADVALINAKYRKQKSDLENQENERQAGKAKAYAEAGANLALGVLRNSLQASSSARMQSLSDAKSRELANTSLTGSQKAAIEEKYRRLELKEKVKAFRAQQKLDIAQALISGALAMLKFDSQLGILGFAFKPQIIAQTAASVTLIAAQKPPSYSTGGLHYTSDNKGGMLKGPGTGTSDSMNAYVSNGESIINAKSTAMYGGLLSAINVAGGGKPFGTNHSNNFAVGGMVGQSFLPTSSNPAQYRPVVQTFDYAALVSAMANMPRPVVDVKDIAYQMQIKATVENRANL